ncbi:MAG TPA: hypothetical protein VN828_03680, partial [Acidobacteriaceae bacterium]|nr:hypothetical protein [Acidobacteriaceae bacterium]
MKNLFALLLLAGISTAALGQASVGVGSGSATPAANGTASAGTSIYFSRQDHVHPTDTTRAPIASPTFTGIAGSPAFYVGNSTAASGYYIQFWDQATSGQYSDLSMSGGNLQFANSYGYYIFNSPSSSRSLNLQESGSPYAAAQLWFDGTSAGSTGTWFKSPLSTNIQLGDSAGTYSLNIINSSGVNKASINSNGVLTVTSCTGCGTGSSGMSGMTATQVPLAASANTVTSSVPSDSLSTGDYPVNKYGAIGNGSSHQACTTLGLSTLAQLQAYSGGIYSFATNCTNQMDWLAAQYAVNLANTNGGGKVRFNVGTYIFDQTLVMPLNQNAGTGSGKSVSIIGQGTGETFIEPASADLGSGTGLISCGSPTAA